MKRHGWSSSLRNMWNKGKHRGPLPYNADLRPGNGGMTIGNPAVVPVDTGRGMEDEKVDGRYRMTGRQLARRESENVLYERRGDVLVNPMTLTDQSMSRSPESDFPILVPMQSFTRLPIDQRPRQPLPVESPRPLTRIIPQTQPPGAVQASRGEHSAQKRRISTISQPVDSDRGGVLVTNMSPQGYSTLERYGSMESQKAVTRREGERKMRVSSLEADADPGYETLSKFMAKASPSMSPVPAASPVLTVMGTGGVVMQMQIPVTVHAEPTHHTYVNEDAEERALMSEATLPVVSPAQRQPYMAMSLHPRQGSVELVRTGNERRITSVSNPMYSYPQPGSKSVRDERSEESAIPQQHAAEASVFESDYRSKTISPIEGVGIDVPEDVTDVTAGSVGHSSYWI